MPLPTVPFVPRFGCDTRAVSLPRLLAGLCSLFHRHTTRSGRRSNFALRSSLLGGACRSIRTTAIYSQATETSSVRCCADQSSALLAATSQYKYAASNIPLNRTRVTPHRFLLLNQPRRLRRRYKSSCRFRLLYAAGRLHFRFNAFQSLLYSLIVALWYS